MNVLVQIGNCMICLHFILKMKKAVQNEYRKYFQNAHSKTCFLDFCYTTGNLILEKRLRLFIITKTALRTMKQGNN